MKKSRLSGRIGAFVMLAIFMVGVTPKIYLHDLISNHCDIAFETPYGKKPVIKAYEFNCGLVTVNAVVSSFVTSPVFVFAALPDGALPPYFEVTAGLCASAPGLSSLRGPPAA